MDLLDLRHTGEDSFARAEPERRCNTLRSDVPGWEVVGRRGALEERKQRKRAETRRVLGRVALIAGSSEVWW
jgi:hypothetical protein